MTIARLNECFREGIAAHDAGKDADANPYDFVTAECGSWSKGWWYAEDKEAAPFLERPKSSGA
jgi:hypothetical protein